MTSEIALAPEDFPRDSDIDVNFQLIDFPRYRKTIAEKVEPTDTEPQRSPKSKKREAIQAIEEEEEKDSPRMESKVAPLNIDERSSASVERASDREFRLPRARTQHEKTPPGTPTASRHERKESRSPSPSPDPRSGKVQEKTELVAAPKLTLDMTNPVALRKFLVEPLPQGALLQGIITRMKAGMFSRYPLFELHMDTEMGVLAGKLLMCAKKQTGNKTSNYHIGMDRVNFDTNSKNYLGKVHHPSSPPSFLLLSLRYYFVFARFVRIFWAASTCSTMMASPLRRVLMSIGATESSGGN